MRPRYLAFALALTLASGVAAAPLTPSHAAIDITVDVAPPPLPVYEQPPLPGPGYVWTPGYWSYDADFGYYWVPGTWVEPPERGVLWTPGYWGWANGAYVWNPGYWGPTVGFYGGVDYGFGYSGNGFYGGRWDHGQFFYNSAAWNTGGIRDHSYRENFARSENGNRASFNGGEGGIMARPTAEQERAAHERHFAATGTQTRQVSAARNDPRLRASANHGAPPVAATARAGDFRAHPVAATNRPNPRIGTERNGAPGATPAVRNAARPGGIPAVRNGARPGATPAERNAARPGGIPAVRNAARPGATPAERNAAERNGARQGAAGYNAARAGSPNAAMHHAGPPSAEHPAVAHPTRPAVHPAPAHPAAARPMERPAIHQAPTRPAAAPRPTPAPRPQARPAAAPRPAARPAAPGRQEEKKP